MDKRDQATKGGNKGKRRPRPLDETDYAILRLLQEDAGRSDAALARSVGLSQSGIKKRLHKLGTRGVIRRRVTLLDPEAVNLGLVCFVQVFLRHHEPDAVQGFCGIAREMPEVLECHLLTGEHDYLLKVVARDYRHLQQVLASELAAIPGVDRLLTSIVLDEIKCTTELPLDLALAELEPELAEAR